MTIFGEATVGEQSPRITLLFYVGFDSSEIFLGTFHGHHATLAESAAEVTSPCSRTCPSESGQVLPRVPR